MAQERSPKLLSCFESPEDEELRRDLGWAAAKLKDRDPVVRWCAAAGMGRYGEDAIDWLIPALNDSSSLVRSGAAEALRQIGSARAVEPLIVALKDENSSVRRHAAEALGKIGDARATKPLITALKDEQPWVGEAAAAALGGIGDYRAILPLMAAFENGNSDMRKTAAGTLLKIGEADAAKLLVAALNNVAKVLEVAVRLLPHYIARRRHEKALVAALRRWFPSATTDKSSGCGDDQSARERT